MPENMGRNALCAGRQGHWRGWKCERQNPHHDGPCALVPLWWNLRGRLAYRKAVK